ncbi:MAG: hypothetical protein NC548_21380 [Lachnospiraceae bacterium]|nr:hypothetical protein [Lachnospiraceae bacterium]
MPNFKYDNKMGIMMHVKNKQIYFARSMSGGLRVDDQINNVKYVVERNGGIKFISGLKKEVNIYDHRNAQIIAERVKRMFGISHKYSNYKMFLKGYHIVESFDDFVNEGFLSKTINRSKSGDIRREQGISVDSPVGKIVLGDKSCGKPYMLNKINKEYFFVINEHDRDYILFGYVDDDVYVYFVYNETEDDKLRQIATSDYDMVEDDFILIRALINGDYYNVDDDNCFHIHTMSGGEWYEVDSEDDKHFRIFDDYRNAEMMADDYLRNRGVPIYNEQDADYYCEYLDSKQLEDEMRNHYEYYIEDIEGESGQMGNRLFDEFEEHEIIEDTDEYFETNEDGELNYDAPLFDIDDKKTEYMDELCDQDPVYWYVINFGVDNIERYFDMDKYINDIIKNEGVGRVLATYSEHEFKQDDYEIYIYEVD